MHELLEAKEAANSPTPGAEGEGGAGWLRRAVKVGSMGPVGWDVSQRSFWFNLSWYPVGPFKYVGSCLLSLECFQGL